MPATIPLRYACSRGALPTRVAQKTTTCTCACDAVTDKGEIETYTREPSPAHGFGTICEQSLRTLSDTTSTARSNRTAVSPLIGAPNAASDWRTLNPTPRLEAEMPENVLSGATTTRNATFAI